MAHYNPRETYGSLMVFHVTTIRCNVVVDDVMRMWMVSDVVTVVVLVVSGGVVVVLLLGRLSLAVLLVLHTPILEPDFHLTFGKIEVPSKFPALLLRNVSVEQELFFQFERLEFRVRFAFLANSHLPRPFQRICPRPTRHSNPH